MRYYILIIFITCIGCKTKTVYVPLKEVHQETTYLRDTVVDIKLVPYYQEREIESDSSYLENEYAFSMAKWNGKGIIHSLGMFNKNIPVQIKYPEKHTIDSIPYPVEVEKEKKEIYKLRWYDELLKNIGILSIIVIVIALFVRYLKLK